MIDKATIEKILDTADIVDVVSDFVALKKRGSSYVACCPFHNEKTPSFHVTPRLGIFKCFGCGKAGNAVSFVMQHENMSYSEALKYLGRKYGIEVVEKEESAEEIASRQRRESLIIVNDFAQKYYTTALFETEEGKAVGLSYFQERGFSKKTIEDFLLGYADSDRDSFSKNAIARGYKRDFLLELGLSVEDNTGTLHDRVYERVIFPIRGITGQVVGFGARKLRGDNNAPKYINSPENILYVKNKTLYGLYEAKNEISKKENCYLVEGYTDVISLHQSGILNVVASCGTALTPEQIKLIKRFSPKVTIIYDGDAAGIHASLRGIDMFLSEGLNVKVALFPDGEDPDSYARSHTPEELAEFLASAEEDFIYYQLRTLSQGAENDPFKLGKIIGEMAQSISLIPDSITRNVYVNECAKKMKISADAISERIADLRGRRNIDEFRRKSRAEERERREGTPDALRTSSFNEAEKEIIYYLLKFGQYTLRNRENFLYNIEKKREERVADFIKTQLECDALQIEDPVLKKIYDEYFTLTSVEQKDIEKHFTVNSDPAVATSAINILESEYQLRSKKISDSLLEEKTVLHTLVPKAMYIYKSLYLAKKMVKLREQLQLNDDASDEESKEDILKDIQQLAKVKMALDKIIKDIQ